MKNQISIFIWMVTILYMTIGCGEKNKTPILQGGTLENTSWTLVKFTSHTAEGLDITLNFEKERMHGKAVCNNYFSRYTVSDNTISFEPVGATRMMCENNGKLEIDYFNQFSKTNEFGVKNGKLILKNSLGILEFRKKDFIKKAPILEENTLGEVSLNKEYSVIEHELRELFPKGNIQRNKVDMEDGSYDQINIVSDADTIKGVLLGQPEHLKSLEIISDKIKDMYGVQMGMSFATVKTLRPNIKIQTDSHFHTYAFVEGSNIKYEICCNEIGPDKMNWSMEEVKNWKIKSLNWQKD
tara:strand:+ start:498 stop:1388 length:891 start_codon:yes stop_codon:yes gene_type:complete